MVAESIAPPATNSEYLGDRIGARLPALDGCICNSEKSGCRAVVKIIGYLLNAINDLRHLFATENATDCHSWRAPF
jgi:hypothetical protein